MLCMARIVLFFLILSACAAAHLRQEGFSEIELPKTTLPLPAVHLLPVTSKRAMSTALVMSVLCDLMASTSILSHPYFSAWYCDMSVTTPLWCSWNGLSCDYSGNIWYWTMSGMQITGTLPESIGLLTTLQYMLMDFNKLNGTLPSTMCYLPFNSIHLSDNQFTGTIPNCVGNWSYIVDLQLQNNRFSGTIPRSFGDCRLLSDVRLYNNRLTGNIPVHLQSMSNLQYLTINNNLLNGSLPDLFGPLNKLILLDLSFNSFTGSPPPSLGTGANLKTLQLQNNLFSGSLTESLSFVDYLNVSSNRFVGSVIPTSWTSSGAQLRSVDLTNNQLTGTIPEALCDNELLIRLFIEGNPVYQAPSFDKACYPGCLRLLEEDFYSTYNRCYGTEDKALCDLAFELNIADVVADEIIYTTLTYDSTHYPNFWTYDEHLIDIPNAYEFHVSFSGLTQLSPGQTFIKLMNASSYSYLTIGSSFDTLPGYGEPTLVISDSYLRIYSLLASGDYGYTVTVTVLSRGAGWQCRNESTYIDGFQTYKWFAYPCFWTGVTCAYGSLITGLNLKALNLDGTLPDSIGGLLDVVALDLSFNNIRGSLPQSLGNLTKMSTMNLASNSLSGTLPDSLSDLKTLNYLSVANNKLNGTIPEALAGMTSLMTLMLDANFFTNMLTHTLCRLPRNGTVVHVRSTDLTCFDACWSAFGDSIFYHDVTLMACAPSASPSAQPTAPSFAPTSQPILVAHSQDSSSTTVTIIVAVCSVGGAFLLFCAFFSVYERRRPKILPTEKDLKLAEMLKRCPVHRAVIQAEFIGIELIREHLDSVMEETPDGKTAFDLILDRGEHCEISDEAMFLVLQAALPLQLGKGASMSVGSPITNTAWCRIVQQNDERSLRVVEKMLSTYKVYARALANATDSFGRKCINIASPQCKDAIHRKLYLHERYELFEGPAEYKTATSIVRFALDHRTLLEDEHGQKTPKKVALKFLSFADALQRELDNRSFGNVQDNARFIVTVLSSYNGDRTDEENRAFRMDAITKGFVDYPYCVVMDAADHNLQRMIATQHIAGTDWEEIRRLFKQVCQSVHYLHSKGVIHGDLKPTNIVEVDKSIRLIDFDGSVSFAKNQMAGIKFSTTYCPPEMLYMDREQKVLPKYSRVRGDALEVEDLVDLKYECVAASPALDMWALGAILYIMSTGTPLFCSNVEDNIPDREDLLLLYQWESAVKDKKLMNVSDALARNLISLLLVKDPQKRIDTTRMLDHPFLSGKQVARLAGEQAEFQVFVSYRVASDAHIAQRLYNDLTKVGVKVWLDSKCLKPGKNWEVGFCEGMLKSDYVVCCISEEGMQHSEKESQCLNRLRAESKCDNVLLEWMLALELLRRGIVKGIFPIFIGKTKDETHYSRFYLNSSAMPEVSVVAVEEKLKNHLDLQGCGLPYVLNCSVKSVVDSITSNQGMFLEGEMDDCVVDIIDRISKMVTA